jgi:hypothetical protein
MIGYAVPEEIAADCLFEAQGNVVEAQRLARRHIVGEDDYRHVAKLIEAAAERQHHRADDQHHEQRVHQRAHPRSPSLTLREIP